MCDKGLRLIHGLDGPPHEATPITVNTVLPKYPVYKAVNLLNHILYICFWIDKSFPICWNKLLISSTFTILWNNFTTNLKWFLRRMASLRKPPWSLQGEPGSRWKAGISINTAWLDESLSQQTTSFSLSPTNHTFNLFH